MLMCPERDDKISQDRSYCGTCGTNIEENSLQSIDYKNRSMIADGYQLLHQKRAEEALMIAQLCLKADPYYKHAWSLLGDCHQEQGRLIDALTCYEKAVDLDPHGNLDRLKISFIRKQFSPAGSQKKINYKRKGLAIGIACLSASVVCLSGMFFILTKQAISSPKPLLAKQMPDDLEVESFDAEPLSSHPSTNSPATSYAHGPMYNSGPTPQVPPSPYPQDYPSRSYQTSQISDDQTQVEQAIPRVNPPLPLPLCDQALEENDVYTPVAPTPPITPPAPNLKLIPTNPPQQQEEGGQVTQQKATITADNVLNDEKPTEPQQEAPKLQPELQTPLPSESVVEILPSSEETE